MVTSGTGHDRCPSQHPGPKGTRRPPSPVATTKFVRAKKSFKGSFEFCWNMMAVFSSPNSLILLVNQLQYLQVGPGTGLLTSDGLKLRKHPAIALR